MKFILLTIALLLSNSPAYDCYDTNPDDGFPSKIACFRGNCYPGFHKVEGYTCTIQDSGTSNMMDLVPCVQDSTSAHQVENQENGIKVEGMQWNTQVTIISACISLASMCVTCFSLSRIIKIKND